MGWIMGTSAIYEYAATIMAPRYPLLKVRATKIEVGLSAAPIMPIEEASAIEAYKLYAHIVMNMFT